MRALTRPSSKLNQQAIQRRNEVLAREGIDTGYSRIHSSKHQNGRNEVLARDGIDTLKLSILNTLEILVEMRYQPERALTQYFPHIHIVLLL